MFYLAANTTHDSNCDMSYPYFIPDYPEQIFLVLKDMPFKGYSIIPNKYSVFWKLKFLEKLNEKKVLLIELILNKLELEMYN